MAGEPRTNTVSFTREELRSFEGGEVPDLVGPGLRLLFVGINPGLWTAAVQTHFAHPANRFYPALAAAGITTTRIDPRAGMTAADREAFVARGLGITNLVRRATVRADELKPSELRAGGQRLIEFVAAHRPEVVAVAGITAYRAAFGRRTASAGAQTDIPDGWPAEVSLWVVPNPSGLNAHETIDSLARSYAEAARAAGVI